MGTMGYEVFQKDGNVFVKQGGRIQKKLPLTEIEALYKKGYQDKARNRQLRAYLKSIGMSVRIRRNCRRR